jgi:hypothetical protein
MMDFGKIAFLHVSIMTGSAGSTAPISSRLSLPVVIYFLEASRLCPVQFRLKVMNSQSFSISMNIVAHNDMILFARGQRMGPMLALTFSFHSPISSRCYAFLDGLNPLKTHGETQETAAIQRYNPMFPW